MKIYLASLISALMAFTVSANAQSKSRIPPIETYKLMLDGNKESGWVAFRNINGQQWVYFSALQTLHCRLKEIRYSINSDALDQRFNLVKCNPQLPFSLPSDSKVGDTAMNFPLGTVKSLAVQVVWENDAESDIAIYEPCEDVGEQTCSWLVE